MRTHELYKMAGVKTDKQLLYDIFTKMKKDALMLLIMIGVFFVYVVLMKLLGL